MKKKKKGEEEERTTTNGSLCLLDGQLAAGELRQRAKL